MGGLPKSIDKRPHRPAKYYRNEATSLYCQPNCYGEHPMKHLLISLFSVLLCTHVMADQHALPEVSSLSLRDKIAQLCVVAAVSHEESNQDVIDFWAQWEPRYCLKEDYVANLIREQGIGGVIFYSRHTLPQQQLTLTQHFQSLSRIPLLITLDAERGLCSRFERNSVLAFPYNMILGDLNDTDLTYKVGLEVGEQLKAIGVHVNFAPVVDVNNNPDNPIIGMRSFAADKNVVAAHSIAYMRGLHDAGIISCAKHFPGHGDTTVDSHEELPLISHSRQRLDDIELYPFRKMIANGVHAVMLAHLEVPALEPTIGLPASLSYNIATELLQHELGFAGLVVTDALGMKGVTKNFSPGEIEVKALQAGADILLCPIDPIKAIDSIEKAVKDGTISEAEIDRKVNKVFLAKAWAFKNALESFEDPYIKLYSPEARDLIHAIYSNSVRVVKNDNDFPIFDSLQKCIVINFGETLEALAEKCSKSVLEYIDLPLRPMPENQHILEAAINPASQIVLTLQGDYPFKEELYADFLRQLIREMRTDGKSVAVVLFCSPYLQKYVQEADIIIQAYDNNDEAQNAAAALLWGDH